MNKTAEWELDPDNRFGDQWVTTVDDFFVYALDEGGWELIDMDGGSVAHGQASNLEEAKMQSLEKIDYLQAADNDWNTYAHKHFARRKTATGKGDSG